MLNRYDVEEHVPSRETSWDDITVRTSVRQLSALTL
jgi:hypothetical protein